jgi:hypothetical protein
MQSFTIRVNQQSYTVEAMPEGQPGPDRDQVQLRERPLRILHRSSGW